MNFLSHLFLSGNKEGLIIGNFIADSLKATEFKNYSADIQKGIFLHHKIDAYTDSHPIVAQSKNRLRANYKKYAGVIVDVYYDHFLAINWNIYSETSLESYTENIYSIIKANHHLLPYKSQQFTNYMLQNNILLAYAKLEGIERVLYGMSRRAKFVSNMEHSAVDLKEHFALFENEFNQFFPQLQEHVLSEIKLLA